MNGEERASEIEFTDRYGGNYPDPATVCQGQCEGLGVYPQQIEDPDATEYERGQIEQMLRDGAEPEGGYVFITCGECGGTGKRREAVVKPDIFVLMQNDYPRHCYTDEDKAHTELENLNAEERRKVAAKEGGRRIYYHVQRVGLD